MRTSQGLRIVIGCATGDFGLCVGTVRSANPGRGLNEEVGILTVVLPYVCTLATGGVRPSHCDNRCVRANGDSWRVSCTVSNVAGISLIKRETS